MREIERQESKYPDKYWEERFNCWDADIGVDVPRRVKRAIQRVYEAYPPDCLPQGICDPMYIMNVICFELGVGDGEGKFQLPESGKVEE